MWQCSRGDTQKLSQSRKQPECTSNADKTRDVRARKKGGLQSMTRGQGPCICG